MKGEYARGLFLYRSSRSIERDLANYAEWFNTERPHQGLGGRMPDEAHRGKRRRRSRRRPVRATLRVSYLRDDRPLPVLRLLTA